MHWVKGTKPEIPAYYIVKNEEGYVILHFNGVDWSDQTKDITHYCMFVEPFNGPQTLYTQDSNNVTNKLLLSKM